MYEYSKSVDYSRACKNHGFELHAMKWQMQSKTNKQNKTKKLKNIMDGWTFGCSSNQFTGQTQCLKEAIAQPVWATKGCINSSHSTSTVELWLHHWTRWKGLSKWMKVHKQGPQANIQDSLKTENMCQHFYLQASYTCSINATQVFCPLPCAAIYM